MTDADARLWRLRLVECLVELASPPDQQVTLLAERGWRVDDLAETFAGFFHYRGRFGLRGAFSAESLAAANAANDALEGIGPGQWTVDALRNSTEWQAVRDAATAALTAFRADGVPTPALTDPDFNTPRTDAP